MQRRKPLSKLRKPSEMTHLKKTFTLSKSNIIDSLIPLLLSTSIVHNEERITDITFSLCDAKTYNVQLKIEKES
jgi:hypothetical protein